MSIRLASHQVTRTEALDSESSRRRRRPPSPTSGLRSAGSEETEGAVGIQFSRDKEADTVPGFTGRPGVHSPSNPGLRAAGEGAKHEPDVESGPTREGERKMLFTNLGISDPSIPKTTFHTIHYPKTGSSLDQIRWLPCDKLAWLLPSEWSEEMALAHLRYQIEIATLDKLWAARTFQYLDGPLAGGSEIPGAVTTFHCWPSRYAFRVLGARYWLGDPVIRLDEEGARVATVEFGFEVLQAFAPTVYSEGELEGMTEEQRRRAEESVRSGEALVVQERHQ